MWAKNENIIRRNGPMSRFFMHALWRQASFRLTTRVFFNKCSHTAVLVPCFYRSAMKTINSAASRGPLSPRPSGSPPLPSCSWRPQQMQQEEPRPSWWWAEASQGLVCSRRWWENKPERPCPLANHTKRSSLEIIWHCRSEMQASATTAAHTLVQVKKIYHAQSGR